MGVIAGRIGIRWTLGGGAALCVLTAIALIVNPRWTVEAVVPADMKSTIPPPRILRRRRLGTDNTQGNKHQLRKTR